MDNEVQIATAAMVIALVALTIATGQFLQQIFGTAEGYRRCQDSVIGPWARRTRLSWRWKGFRFETKFTTPVIFFETTVEAAHKQINSTRELYFLCDEGEPYRLGGNSGEPLPQAQSVSRELRETLDRDNTKNDTFYTPDTPDAVTWMPLLRALYNQEQRVTEPMFPGSEGGRVEADINNKRGVSIALTRIQAQTTYDGSWRAYAAVQLVERSWDLIPPDVVRPFAQTTVGGLITIVNRLGMRWQDFKPSDGVLSAQGNGHSISSSQIRGLGIMCEYRCTRGLVTLDEETTSTQLVPSLESDMMRCGLIPPSKLSGLKPIPLVSAGGTDQILFEAFLDTVGLGKMIREPAYGPTLQRCRRYLISDSVAILSPFMPVEGSSVCRIPYPFEWESISMFLFWEGRVVLLNKLKAQIANGTGDVPGKPPVLEWKNRVLEGLMHLEETFADDFYCRWDRAVTRDHSMSARKWQLIEFCRKEHAWAGEILKNGKMRDSLLIGPDDATDNQWGPLTFHLDTIIRVYDEAQTAQKEEDGYVDDEHRGPLLYAPMLKLAECCANEVAKLPDYHSGLWWVMAYRAICWFSSVERDQSQAGLPSSYYKSSIPVYLG